MGHQVNRASRPRRGSLEVWPRVRAKRFYSRISNWPEDEKKRLLGTAGYKVGMTDVMIVDNNPNSTTKGGKISIPVTVLEVPPLRVAAIRFYRENERGDLEVETEVWSQDLDKVLSRKLDLPSEVPDPEELFEDLDLDEIEETRAIVYTLPDGKVSKKKPEIFEIGLGGKSLEDRLDYAKEVLGDKLSAKDVLDSGEQVDAVAVTKGKGFQGTIQRYGAKLESRRTDKVRRGIGAMGQDIPRKTIWRVPMPGQQGFHKRTDLNKRIIKIGDDGEEITPDGGFTNYGEVEGEYILLKGSVPGPKKRLVRLRSAIRPNDSISDEAPEIV